MNEEIKVAQKCNRRKIIKILCAVLVCLLCFSLGVGGTAGWLYYVTGEFGAKLNNRITAEDVCLDGKRIEGTIDGRYLYYTLENNSIFDLYHKETVIQKQDPSGPKTIEKNQDLNAESDKSAQPQKQAEVDVAAFQKMERYLYLDLWQITEAGTYYVAITYMAVFEGLCQDVRVVITVDIPAAS